MTTGRFAAVAAAAVATMTLAGVAGAQDRRPDDRRPDDAPQGRAAPQTGRMLGGNAPPADQPLIPRIPEPRVSVEGGLGVLGFVGGAADVGFGWNVRVTGAMSPSVAVEGNYVGSVNERTAIKKSLVMTAFDAGFRYNIVRADQAFVQPFVVAGLGYAGWAGEGGDAFSLTVPLSVGAERLITRNVKLGARFTFRPAFFDDLTLAGGARTGGDSWALLAHGGGAF